jgi:ATP-binding cassette subfamily G (WHITE) protein 2 (SNQ2)
MRNGLGRDLRRETSGRTTLALVGPSIAKDVLTPACGFCQILFCLLLVVLRSKVSLVVISHTPFGVHRPPRTHLFFSSVTTEAIALPATSMEKTDMDKETGGPTFEAIHSPNRNVRRDSESTIGDTGLHTTEKTGTHPHGVNISRAEASFAELNRELSRTSQLSRVQSRHSRKAADVEKATDEASSEEPFDLESVLRGNRDEEERAGIKSKRIGVVFEDLTVSGIGGVKNYVKTFPDAFVSFFNVYATARNMLGLGKRGREFDILKDFRGVVNPGEMCLVLGRPGSGCTTFLKVISNQRYGYTNIDGKVLYGPFDSNLFEKRYRGEAVYCEEEENHHPTLTVGQTLDFALETKVPGKRPGGLSRKDFKERVIDLMLKMFNIEHTRNTIVGNPFVRGISGGERKRVSIAETMVTGASVISWDNSTRGLDASTAVDYARSLRVLTNIYKTTTFVSLYQASENIYKCFDKVLVIDSGRQVYFGPAKEARAYFEGLGFREKPRQTTPDYLTGCTDPFEREYKDGRNEKDVPSTPDDLAKAFQNSAIAAKVNAEMVEYNARMAQEKHVYDEFETAVAESKRHAPKKSVYAIPFYLQMWALAKRQFLLKWQDKFGLVVSWITSIVIAIIVGTVWLDLPQTSDGAFTRGGVLFISLLFNAFQAFSELPAVMMGRPIINKHRAFTFHRPSALWLAQIGVDLLFSSVQIFVFSVMVYFMTGLVRDAGAFFIFYLMIVTGYLAMTLFFRTVGCLCPDFDVAIRLAATIITLFVLTSGYIIQWQSEQVWLRWIFYINALGLAFSALMMNEFGRLDLTCAGTSLIPSGPGYDDINRQVCTLPGSEAGSLIVRGKDYISQAFTYNTQDLWRNWGIIIVLIVAFLCANAFLGEFIKWGAGGRTVTFFLKEDNELKELNEKLRTKREKRNRKEDDTDASSGLNITSKAVLTWEDLCYDVPVPSGQLRLLNNIFGYVKPGQLTALMGASGAGKTTLLDV